MEFSEYQVRSSRTSAKSGNDRIDSLVSAVGLVGEAGEVAELVKKQIGHGKPISPTRIAEELGDVLWYAADIATRNNLCLSQVAANNVAKLTDRYPDGFTPAKQDDAEPTTRERLEAIARTVEAAREDWYRLVETYQDELPPQAKNGFQDAIGIASYWLTKMAANRG